MTKAQLRKLLTIRNTLGYAFTEVYEISTAELKAIEAKPESWRESAEGKAEKLIANFLDDAVTDLAKALANFRNAGIP